MQINHVARSITLAAVCMHLLVSNGTAQIERFIPMQGGNHEVWRITHDPASRDWINYHNRQAWSPDGRYLCLTRSGSGRGDSVWLADLHKGTVRELEEGDSPRWANRHNWLFYKRSRPELGPAWGKGTEIMWLDADTGKLTRIGWGISDMKYTDYQDRWLYGIEALEGNQHVNGEGLQTRGRGVRLPIREDSRLEVLEWAGGYGYGSLYVNPGHPMILNRDHGFRQFYYTTPGMRDIPFVARIQVDTDLEGRNATRPFPLMEGSHFSWSGDGEWFLCGNGQIRGRRWDEPLPSNIHYLAIAIVGDVSPASRSGRYICGSNNYGAITVADLRSGDAYSTLPWALSWLHESKNYSYSGGSALHDNDAKGSADGTKITFVSNYDLKDAPVTTVTGEVNEDRIPVASTDGFPPSGRLSVIDEVIGYERKTATSFEGLKRQLYNTGPARLNRGSVVASFEHRLLPEDKRSSSEVSQRAEAAGRQYDEMPLVWQNRTDVYIVVVRKPDAPVLRIFEGQTELIPGEHHYETFGYLLYRDGKKITDVPVRPGSRIALPGAGAYTAAAVEWSGLESPQSAPLKVDNAAALTIYQEKPADFFWTAARWLVEGREVSAAVAQSVPEALCEIDHLSEGRAHREWYSFGMITRRHDLNRSGLAIRRMWYQDGKPLRREFHDAEGRHISTELFAPDGDITEQIQYRDGQEVSHWWYENAEPVKHAGLGSRWGAEDGGMIVRVRQGERWMLESEVQKTVEERKIPR